MLKNKLFFFFYFLIFVSLFCEIFSVDCFAKEPLRKNKNSIFVPVGKSDLLQEVLINAKSGDVITLEGGIYTGNFIIDTPGIILQSQHRALLTSEGKNSILRIESSNVTVRKLKFRHSGKNITAKDACIFISKKADRTHVQNNYFSDCGFGIWVDGSNNNLIGKNKFAGTKFSIVSDRGNSIHLFYTTGSIVRDNEIMDGRDGIYISNSSDVLIKNNTMKNTRFGIHYMYSDNCKVIGNKIFSSRVGAAIMYSKRLRVNDNVFSNNSLHGVLFRDVFYSKIMGNSSSHNKDGLYLGGSYFNKIKNNYFFQNEIGVQVTTQSKDNTVYNNDFIDNQRQAKFLDNKSIVWSYKGRGNYWSNYKGWDKKNDGIGDTKFYVTKLTDWLTFSYPALKVILNSPAMVMLQRIEDQFPVIKKPAIIDEYPLMQAATKHE